ncbi:hypothetical protein JCM10207_009166 [Rhodosporidiobolus poonsookiae]
MNGEYDYQGHPAYQQPPPVYQSAPQYPPGPSGLQLPPGGAIHLSANEATSDTLPKQFLGSTELVKVTAKSCSNCRSRKVKCDRRYPDCSRCIKRKEACDYGDDVSIALRPTWVLATEDEALAPPAQPPLARPPYAPPPAPRPPYAGSAYPYPPARPSPTSTSFDTNRSLRTISNMQHHGGSELVPARRGGQEDDEAQAGFSQLWEKFLMASNLGASSSDWRLAVPTMANSLTIHLIDASMHSCCFHLPAFHIFEPQVRFFKENVDHLDLANQVVVGILTSLGARASPHSALLGVAGPDIENGKASLDLVLSAGMRRENAWRAIVDRATELCSKPEILQVPTTRNAQTLVAFVQMLMLAEAKPKTARFFLRTAMGVFRDMQHSDLSPTEIANIKASVGPTLFESDSRIAAYLSMPVVISDDDLYEYFDGTGVLVPDLATEDLGPLLDDILDPAHGPVTRAKLDRALGLTGYFVCSVQRCFSHISASRRVSNRFLSAIPQLWGFIDRAHAAVQRLHRRLVQLDYVPEGCDVHHSVDYDLLIGVRMDERLLDVVHLAHEYLKKQRKVYGLSPEDRVALEDLLATSERRVRKCLKLLAFYSKVFVDSLDKHVVYHLFTQLEALPDWPVMAAQREGEMTDFGPLPNECALTETELDWFTRALELACFFTPLAHQRLAELKAARQARQRMPLSSEQWTFDLSVPTPAATPGQPRDISAALPSMAPTASMNPGDLSVPGSVQNGAPKSGDSPTWSFDSYGTPLGVGDNLSPPSHHTHTHSPSSTGSAGSAGLGDGTAPPPFGQGQQMYDSSFSSAALNPNGYSTAMPLGSNDRLPSPHSAGSSIGANGLPIPPQPHLLQQQQQQQMPPPVPVAGMPSLGATRPRGDSAASNPAAPSWLAGYDYSAMLNAETSRTGTTPRGSLSALSFAGASGATITELPDEVVGGFADPGMVGGHGQMPQHQQQQQAWGQYGQAGW